MRIIHLEIENFRAIDQIVMSDLEDMVVIAGANGCGKSCIFDAIRLFKSTYGGYQPNEWQSWFNEFQIYFNRYQPDLLRLFQDRNRRLRRLRITLSNTSGGTYTTLKTIFLILNTCFVYLKILTCNRSTLPTKKRSKLPSTIVRENHLEN